MKLKPFAIGTWAFGVVKLSYKESQDGKFGQIDVQISRMNKMDRRLNPEVAQSFDRMLEGNKKGFVIKLLNICRDSTLNILRLQKEDIQVDEPDPNSIARPLSTKDVIDRTLAMESRVQEELIPLNNYLEAIQSAKVNVTVSEPKISRTQLYNLTEN